jgi:Arc/MetJ-type ribon-helix-helix transcriptional regulator
MTKTINLSLPEELLKKIDAAAKGEYASRSDFIRETIVRRLKGQRIVDEWGDNDNWETVVDFREISPRGAGAQEALDALEKLKR